MNNPPVFVSPSAIGTVTNENNPVNISHVYEISRFKHDRIKPVVTGITFKMINATKLTWEYTEEDERDQDYQRILKRFGI